MAECILMGAVQVVRAIVSLSVVVGSSPVAAINFQMTQQLHKKLLFLSRTNCPQIRAFSASEELERRQDLNLRPPCPYSKSVDSDCM